MVKKISISSYSVQSNSSNSNNSVQHKYAVQFYIYFQPPFSFTFSFFLYLLIYLFFTSYKHIDRALSGATILVKSGPGSNGNEGLLCIPQNPWNLTDCLVSYLGYLLGSYPSAKVKSQYSTRMEGRKKGEYTYIHKERKKERKKEKNPHRKKKFHSERKR